MPPTEETRMNDRRTLLHRGIACLLSLAAFAVQAADDPAPVEGDWTVRDFRFHDGTTLPALKLHYTTLGAPTGEPVLILHGTAGSGSNLLSKDFAGELFGRGQPLDASRHYLILPDAIGTGKSSKPSDGLRAKFPAYNYDDMVLAQYRLVTEHLKLKHLKLVMGNSMGGMQTWLWGEQYPGFMDALVPMASLPTEMSARNWMMRRMLIDGIRNDPDYAGGNYTKMPRNLPTVLGWFGIVSSGGTQAYFKAAPTREKADALIEQRMKQPVTADANDLLFQWSASGDYNPAPRLDRIRATLLAINAADDERNPAELGVLERELRRIPNGRMLLIPASAETRGHSTTGMAKFYQQELAAFLRGVEAASK
jgi:homoserine O-acetyltransferase